ncbi:MAG: formylmethanofuran dehydrogenase subunit C [Planctomycetota bacterium]|nr:formylmethanofuran dehydrogenase subunit C [Planctomycetota bacterium]
MSLTLKTKPIEQIPIEADCITPDKLRGLSVSEIEKLQVLQGNQNLPFAEFFDVSGDPSDGDIVIEGNCVKVKLIGTGMSEGSITVHGNVGMHTGAEMSGGRLEVFGNATDWVGAEMKGGHIHIHGDAGHLVGGTYRGGNRGMTGGVILIDGNAKNEVGCVMRRGLIVIGGDAGDFAGADMLAGSILVFGLPGIRSGAGMKRGTIAVFGEEPEDPKRTLELLPTFFYDCDYEPPFLTLYLNQLAGWGFKFPDHVRSGNFRRYSGDLVEMGKGEILVWQA